jgi:hypothetical protein
MTGHAPVREGTVGQPESLRQTTPPRILLVAFAVTAAVAALAGCGGSTAKPNPQATCGPPPPVPLPVVDLVYPIPGASGVAPGIGLLVFYGFVELKPGNSIQLSDAAGTVPVGSVTAAPSPLPTPNATPTNDGNFQQFAAVPVPRLAPGTTYRVALHYLGYADDPPACQATFTLKLGSFRTRPGRP